MPSHVFPQDAPHLHLCFFPGDECVRPFFEVYSRRWYFSETFRNAATIRRTPSVPRRTATETIELDGFARLSARVPPSPISRPADALDSTGMHNSDRCLTLAQIGIMVLTGFFTLRNCWRLSLSFALANLNRWISKCESYIANLIDGSPASHDEYVSSRANRSVGNLKLSVWPSHNCDIVLKHSKRTRYARILAFERRKYKSI